MERQVTDIVDEELLEGMQGQIKSQVVERIEQFRQNYENLLKIGTVLLNKLNEETDLDENVVAQELAKGILDVDQQDMERLDASVKVMSIVDNAAREFEQQQADEDDG